MRHGGIKRVIARPNALRRLFVLHVTNSTITSIPRISFRSDHSLVKERSEIALDGAWCLLKHVSQSLRCLCGRVGEQGQNDLLALADLYRGGQTNPPREIFPPGADRELRGRICYARGTRLVAHGVGHGVIAKTARL